MDYKCLFLLTFWGIFLSRSQTTIPEFLRECYENETFYGPQLPMSLQVVIDIIRKAEKYSANSMNIRTISTSLLHRFKFDGIEFYSESRVKEGVLPFGGTGSQRSKHRIIEELVPGNRLAFPVEALTIQERCTLHRAISNTIWEHGEADRDKLCIEGVTEKFSDRSMPGEPKMCPLEFGVVLTPFGTISLGTVISAIAAALEPQNVSVKLLLGDSENSDRSMWLSLIKRSTTQIDNVWVSTIAGDLAEMAVYQGPVEGKRMSLGATGFWNSSMRPNIFYLVGRDGTFDATRAEIVGGIDGLVIAKKLPKWLEDMENLRLSQILDIYYSYRVSSFDSSARACDRGKAFWNVAPNSMMEEQTFATAQILAYRNSVAYMEEGVLKSMAKLAVNAFNSYTMHNLFTEVHCPQNEKIYPTVEVVVTFDGSWTENYTADFLSVMIEDLDVSIFGSKMGIIHGTTGDWILNVTDSPASLHFAIANNNYTWPSGMNFLKVLDQASSFLDLSWKKRHENRTVGNLGQVLVFLAPRVHFNTVDQQTILKSIKQFKNRHPDVHMVYYVTEYNAKLFEEFLLTQDDHLIKSSNVNDITDVLQTVTRVLRPEKCEMPEKPGSPKAHIEDYVSPRKSVVYQLHPRWRRNTKKVTVTLHNVDYGTIEICTWNQRRNNVRKDNYYCMRLTGHTETVFTDFAVCDENVNCNMTYYEVKGISTRKQCAEIECRAPDYVRFIIRMEKLECSSGNSPKSSFPKIFLTLVSIIYYHQKYSN
ncbi:uncharacterized protein [Venturia canescens]|uniref:uncharacterized protein isoform X2 n=1 Tax=Venturia canescens TaxID=32260 RepID=UPI001C9C101D|nr:uncharacterized protein LOC122418150 isoform X2 [Venturia canescens]